MVKYLVIVVAALALLVFPAAAQDDAALELISQAVEDFAALDSFSFEAEVSLHQTIGAGTGRSAQTLDQNISQHMEGISELSTGNATATLSQDISVNNNGQRVQASMGFDMIVLDGTVYFRFDDLSSNIAALFPEGWVNFTDDRMSFPGADMLDPEGLAQLSSLALIYPINEQTVTEITELDAEELDGQTVRVFTVTLDASAVLEESGDTILGTMNAEAMGVDLETLIEIMSEGMELELTLWIGDDGRLYRIEGVNSISTTLPASLAGGVSATLDQQVTSVITITGFNVPVEIEAPETGA